jgi:hypothetical protein
VQPVAGMPRNVVATSAATAPSPVAAPEADDANAPPPGPADQQPGVAVYGNPNIERQSARARAIAATRPPPWPMAAPEADNAKAPAPGRADQHPDLSDVASDMAKSGATGLMNDALLMAGLGGETRSMLSAEADKVGSLVGLSPQTIDRAKTWIGNTGPVLMGLANPLAAPVMLATRFGPSVDDIKQSIEAATGAPLPTHTPQTTAGRYTQTIAEMLPAVIGGEGGILSRLARNVVLPAIASETAGHAVAGTTAEPYVRFGTAAMAGAAPSLIKAGARAASQILSRSSLAAEPPHVDTATAPLVPIGPWDRALAAARLRGDLD